MHVQEQRAWFFVVIILVSLLVYGVMVAVLGFQHDAFSAFGIMGLVGFAGLIGARKKRQGLLIMDERDREILRCSIQLGFSVFWVVFVLAMMAPMIILGPDGVITVRASSVAVMLFPPLILVYLVKALTTIFLYRRGENGE